MSTCLALQHVGFEDLGAFAPLLGARGFEVDYREAPRDGLAGLDPLAPDLLVVLGGPIGAYEDAAYPWLAAELRLIERRLAARRPVLGICLGAQLMARALGARVYPGHGKEICWGALALNQAGRASPLRHLEGVPVLHWHGDTFEVPHEAALLASTPAYAHQAFALGAYALALQFHPEVTAAGLERWFVGHACEIAAAPGVEVAGLRAATAEHVGRLAPAGAAMLREWLAGAGL